MEEVKSIRDINFVLANRYLKMIGFNRDQHLRNNCLEVIKFIDEWPEHKTSRRIGYIQRGVIELKLTSIGRENYIMKPLFDQLEKLEEEKEVIDEQDGEEENTDEQHEEEIQEHPVS